MSHTADIQPLAELDIREAYQYYEDQAEGLGREFLQSVEDCLTLIETHPLICQELEQDVRRSMLHRFPYGVLYFIEGDQLIVIACLHVKRNPEEWQRRITLL